MILILTQCFPSRLGGVESLVSNLAISLGKSEKIIVFADRQHFFYDSIFDNKHKDKILVKRTGGLKFFRRRKKIKEIRPFIDSKQVKLVIADSWKSLELGIDYLNKKNIPAICLAHGNELLSKKINKTKRIKNTLNKATAIIANSIYTKNLIKNLGLQNIPLHYIYPGALDLRNMKGVEIPNIQGGPIIFTLARLEKRKGHLYIIKSIKELLFDFPDIQYIIAGQGPEEKNLKRLVYDNKLEKNIKFVGSINDAQKKYLLSKADLMVMPTLDESDHLSIEGFGISYLEAAFFSIPSVASNIGGTPEAVLNDLTGKVINNIENLYETIKELLIDNKKRINLGKNAQIRAINEFSWDIIATKHLSIINNLVKND